MSVRDNEYLGKVILKARKSRSLSLKQLASLIYKEDGTPISFQYISEIENGTRNPPSEFLMKQLAVVLDVPIEFLYFHSRTIPGNLTSNLSQDEMVAAYRELLLKLGYDIGRNKELVSRQREL